MKTTTPKTYSEKLRDPRWQKLRLQIMGRDGFRCRHCSETEKTLNVHHVNYERGKMPWDYEDENFLTLCESCHAMLEMRISAVRKAMADWRMGAQITYVASILSGLGPFDHRASVTLDELLIYAFGGYEAAGQAVLEFAGDDGVEADDAIEAAMAQINDAILTFAGRIRSMARENIKSARESIAPPA